jgi:hypothetical protein
MSLKVNQPVAFSAFAKQTFYAAVHMKLTLREARRESGFKISQNCAENLYF